MAGDSARERGAYSTKLRSRRDNGCPSLAHSHAVSTQLYQTPLSFLPHRSSVLFFPPSVLFSPRRPFFSSSQRDRRGRSGDEGGRGGIMTPTGSFFWRGGFREKRPLCSPILPGSTHCPLFCFFSVGVLGFNR